MKVVLGALVGLLAVMSVEASEVRVKGRTEIKSCGYYSSTIGDFTVHYENLEVRWGERVFLVYGLSGLDRVFENGQVVTQAVEWQSRQEREMRAIAPYLWSASVGVELNYRSSARSFDRMPFVFRIEHVDGTSTFDNGGAGAWGFYEVVAPESKSCQSSGIEIRDEVLKVHVVER